MEIAEVMSGHTAHLAEAKKVQKLQAAEAVEEGTPAEGKFFDDVALACWQAWGAFYSLAYIS